METVIDTTMGGAATTAAALVNNIVAEPEPIERRQADVLVAPPAHRTRRGTKLASMTVEQLRAETLERQLEQTRLAAAEELDAAEDLALAGGKLLVEILTL